MVILSDLRTLSRAEKQLTAEIQRARESATQTTARIDGIPHGGRAMSSKVERGAVRAAELEEKRADVLRQLQPMRAELSEMIDELDVIDRPILRLHYLGGHNFDDIADAIGQCRRHVLRIVTAKTAELLQRFPDRLRDS